jgi:uncharacterized protein YdhG (YjbR/CyaY superfamily)
MKPVKAESTDAYIDAQPPKVRELMQQIRKAVREAAPKAEETVSYGMPALRQSGVLVYYAAFKDHLSFFPTGSGVEAFKDKLKGYKTSKGTIQLPLDKPLPLDLIKEIVRFRVKENSAKLS